MKLSYNQFRELYGNRSVTDYTKFNWLGEYPVYKEYDADYVIAVGGGNAKVDLVLPAGTYELEIVNHIITKIGTSARTPNSEGIFIYNELAFKSHLGVGKKYKFTTTRTNEVYFYPNVDASSSSEYEGHYHIVIRKVVENLVADAIGTTGVTVKKKDNNFIITNPTNDFSGLTTSITSNLEYGTYKWNYKVNYQKGLELKIGVYNSTKSQYIVSTTNAETGTFTLTEDNYTVGDNIKIWYMTFNSTTGIIDTSITNFYVCKMSYGIVDLSELVRGITIRTYASEAEIPNAYIPGIALTNGMDNDSLDKQGFTNYGYGTVLNMLPYQYQFRELVNESLYIALPLEYDTIDKIKAKLKTTYLIYKVL